MLYMHHHDLKSIEPRVLQEYFTKASLLLASERFEEAEEAMVELTGRLRTAMTGSHGRTEQDLLAKSLSECFVNLAICLLNRQSGEESGERVDQLLEQAIRLDCQNLWAYFNLASHQYRSFDYHQAFANLVCSLSCLYLLKAVLSKDLENRGREIDLGRAIGYCENNLEARLIRLALQIKQSKWKLAYNEVELAMEIFPECLELQTLRDILEPFKITRNISLTEHKDVFKQCVELIGSVRRCKKRLVATSRCLDEGSILKEMDDKVTEFNEILRQVNELGNSLGVFNFKTVYRTSKLQHKTHIISNLIHQSNQRLHSETLPNSETIELEAKVVERMNESKRSLTEDKLNDSRNNQDSLFELTKSQNLYLENSNKVINGNLLSSLQLTAKPIAALTASLEQSFGQDDPDANAMRKKMQIEVIESEIQPLQHDEYLIDQQGHHFVNEDEDLLLDSIYDTDGSPHPDMRRFDFAPHLERKTTSALIRQERAGGPLSKSQDVTTVLYPSTEVNRIFEIVLVDADFKEDCKEKLIGIYCQLEYNSGLIENYKFRSRQVSQTNANSGRLEWSQSLGLIKLAQEPKNLLVKIYKSEPYLYDDRFLGEGQIEVTTMGTIRIPLYLKMRSVGAANVKVLPSEQNLNNSFKQSVNSGISSSFKSESQNSQG